MIFLLATADVKATFILVDGVMMSLEGGVATAASGEIELVGVGIMM